MGILTWGWGGFAVLMLGLLGYLAHRVFAADELCGEDVCVRRIDEGDQQSSQPAMSQPTAETQLLA